MPLVRSNKGANESVSFAGVTGGITDLADAITPFYFVKCLVILGTLGNDHTYNA